ncbi:hypothetical protein ACFX5K_01325 [Rickettsiales bacterium LUAb2]
MNKTEEELAQAQLDANNNGNDPNTEQQDNGDQLSIGDHLNALHSATGSHRFLLDMLLHLAQPKAGAEQALEKLKDYNNISQDELKEIMSSLGEDQANHTPGNFIKAFITKYSTPAKPTMVDDETVSDSDNNDDDLPTLKIAKSLSKLRSN